MADLPLSAVPGWSPDQVARMGRAWVTTAEQVVAVSATDGGLHSVAEQLGIPDAEAQRLVAAAHAALPSATAREMAQPADTSQYGLGVLKP
ncbi:hypothetical protein [Methylobacterium variabile]|jgi:hypothetical protein|uniref:hypothetical protein n=1 Tax=Methylobacterium variabile TaxID=298794 RepID=UPI000A554759|nr:hypothetical protein [Methylobacterium variabile]